MIIAIALRTLSYFRSFSVAPSTVINLVDRNCVKPIDFTAEEIKSILWTAFDIKQLTAEDQCINNIKSGRITLLMHKPCVEIQASAMSAANLLKGHLNVVIDPTWDTCDFINDKGSFLSTCTDMVFCQSQYQSKIETFAQGASIPVVGVLSCTYDILNTLADLMALQERYNHLANLNIGWLGKPCPLFNTYLCIAPRLRINLRYHCYCKASGKGMSPTKLPVGQKLSEQKHTALVECHKVEDAIKEVHTIVLSKHDVENHKLYLKQIKQKADKHWSFLHQLPRGSEEVASEVFNHKNSLVWEAKGNLQYIYAAFMLRLLSTYEHVYDQPNFDSKENCCE